MKVGVVQARIKIAIGLVGLATITALGFQNCAEPFAVKVSPSGYVGSGSSGAGSGGTGQPGGTTTPTGTPPPDAYKLTISTPISTPLLAASFDPALPSTILAYESGSQMVTLSKDAGVTWARLCTVVGKPNLYTVSGQQYALYDKNLYRVVDVSGGSCPVLRSGTSAITFAVTDAGRLFLAEPSKPMVMSADNGKTWTPLSNAIASSTNSAVNPSLTIFSRDMTGADDVYIAATTTAERAIYKVMANGSVTRLGPAYSLMTSFQVDPKTPTTIYDYYYTSFTYVSKNSGATYDTAAVNDMFSFMADDGSIYRTLYDSTLKVYSLSKRASMASADPWLPIGKYSNPPAIQVLGATIAVLDGKKLLVSLDSGTTYARVSPAMDAANLAITSFAGSGNRLYAASSEYVFRSDDGGDTWVPKQDISGIIFGTAGPRLQVAPGDNNKVYLRSDSHSSTYSNAFVATDDAFETMKDQTIESGFTDLAYGFEVSLALGLDADQSQLLSNTGSFHSFGAGVGWSRKVAPTSPSLFVWYPWLTSVVLPGAPDKSLVGIGAKLYEYSFSANTMTDVSSRLPFTDGVAMELKQVAGMNGKIRVLSNTGSVAESTDGVTFTLKSSGKTSNTIGSGNVQGFLTSADTAGLAMLGFAADTTSTVVTTNGGAAWTTSTHAGCNQRDAVAAKTAWLISCTTGRPRFIAR